MFGWWPLGSPAEGSAASGGDTRMMGFVLTAATAFSRCKESECKTDLVGKVVSLTL